MSDVFVVCGEEGEYSGWSHWLVRAFPTAEAAWGFAHTAQAYVDACPPRVPIPSGVHWTNPKSAEYEQWEAAAGVRSRERAAYITANPYDTKMEQGTTYSVEQIPMGEPD